MCFEKPSTRTISQQKYAYLLRNKFENIYRLRRLRIKWFRLVLGSEFGERQGEMENGIDMHLQVLSEKLSLHAFNGVGLAQASNEVSEKSDTDRVEQKSKISRPQTNGNTSFDAINKCIFYVLLLNEFKTKMIDYFPQLYLRLRKK